MSSSTVILLKDSGNPERKLFMQGSRPKTKLVFALQFLEALTLFSELSLNFVLLWQYLTIGSKQFYLCLKPYSAITHKTQSNDSTEASLHATSENCMGGFFQPPEAVLQFYTSCQICSTQGLNATPPVFLDLLQHDYTVNSQDYGSNRGSLLR